jgi:HK97 family phage major capsid protein
MNVLITKLRDERDSLKASLDSIVETASDENRDFDSTEEANFNEGAERLEALNKRLEQLEKVELRSAEASNLSKKVDEATKNGVVKVRSEELTYREDGEHSFVRDVFLSQEMRDASASERLARHAEESLEQRDATMTDFGGLIVPAYLTSKYAPVLHGGQPTVNITNRSPLVGATAYIPKGVDDVAIGAQEDEGDLVATNDPTAVDITVNAKTYAGRVKISRQALELGSFSAEFINQQLFSKYAEQLNAAVVAGTGATGTHKGILSTSGTTSLNGSAVADHTAFSALVEKAKTAVRKSKAGKATHIIMNSDVYGWLLTQEDTTGRPLIGFDYSAPQNVHGTEGTYKGLKIVVDDAIPAVANGSLADKSTVVVVNSAELYLFEKNGGAPMSLSVDHAANLQIELVAYGYTAFTADVRPKAIAKITDLALG